MTRCVFFVLSLFLTAACLGTKVVPAEAFVEVRPTAIDFGTTPAGTAVQSQNIKVSNLSRKAFTLQTIESDAPAFSGPSGPFVVEAGATLTLQLSFKPATEGPQISVVHFRSDARNNDVQISVSGAGAAAQPCTVCTTPPANYCQSDTIAVYHSVLGVCMGSSCDYQPLEVSCSTSCDPLTGRCTQPGGTEDFVCSSQTSGSIATTTSADIIFVIDNSPSMADEIRGVEQNINENLASVMADAGVDYQVIVISKHGSAAATQSVCIKGPLSGTNCNPPPTSPANTSRFYHQDTRVNGVNSLDMIVSTYSEWSSRLRQDAFKTFITVSDADPREKTAASDLDTALLSSPAQFGTPTQRNYVFHSIIWVVAKPDVTSPYLPSEPPVTSRCLSAENFAPHNQELSRLTGGLRFSICNPASYSGIFQKIAESVIHSTQVACEFIIPAPDPGLERGDNITINYSPGNGVPSYALTQVADAASCPTGAFAFYEAEGQVRLCPDACGAIQANSLAGLQVLFTCRSLDGGT